MNKKYLAELFFATLILIVAFALTLAIFPSAETNQSTLGSSAIYENNGADTAIILFHGLTASPEEVRPLLDVFAEEGFAVYAPVLKGHGTTPEALKTVTWQDWLFQAQRVYDEVALQHERVFVGGVSLGGDLALMLSATNDVQGVIAIGPPIVLRDKRTYLSRLLAPLLTYVDHPLEEGEETIYYNEVPPSAIAELLSLITQLKANLNRISAPVLIFQGRDDPTVEPASAEYILEHVSSSKARIKYFNARSHVLIDRPEFAQEVFEESLVFISEN